MKQRKMLIFALRMNELREIQQLLSKELDELNSTMRLALNSKIPLLQHIVNSFLERKGKQIRPLMVLLSAKIFGGINNSTLNAAAAIELLHNASLVHDDVLDESMTRRGVATINYNWDNQVAVLVGDFFVSRALHCAVQTGDIAIVEVLSSLGSELSSGEINQIDNARAHNINEELYLQVISHKTASLFRSCVKVGGKSAGADSETLELLVKYAEEFGKCFQIKDDIFDYYDCEEVGKPTGNDLREGKITLPLIYALSKDDAEGVEQMRQLVVKDSLTTEDINALINFAKREGGIEYAYKRMDEIRDAANRMVAHLPQNEGMQTLRRLFDFIISRNA